VNAGYGTLSMHLTSTAAANPNAILERKMDRVGANLLLKASAGVERAASSSASNARK
jgi:hypothetical protein